MSDATNGLEAHGKNGRRFKQQDLEALFKRVGAESNNFDMIFLLNAVGAAVTVIAAINIAGCHIPGAEGIAVLAGAAWVVKEAKICRVLRYAEQRLAVIANEQGISTIACQMNRVETMCPIILASQDDIYEPYLLQKQVPGT